MYSILNISGEGMNSEESFSENDSGSGTSMVKCSGTYPCRCEIECKCVYNNTIIVYRFIYAHVFRRAHTH